VEFSILKYKKTTEFKTQFPNYSYIDDIFEIKAQGDLSLELLDLHSFKELLFGRFNKKLSNPVWYFE